MAAPSLSSLRSLLPLPCCALLFLVLPFSQAAAGADLATANKLLLTGRYEAAAEAFTGLRAADSVQAALGLARCCNATGKQEDATATVRAAFDDSPESAPLAAELALQALRRGDHAEAHELAEKALSTAPHQLTARWVRAELRRVAGRLDAADEAYEWFVDYYNGHEQFTPDELRWIGRAAAQYARWHRNSNQFRFLVTELYPDALRLNEDYWPARLEMALLFAEKYNTGEAKAQLAAALAINPNAAEIHAARAHLALQAFALPVAEQHIERALEINPRLLVAHQARADVQLAKLDYDDAIATLEAVRTSSPVDEATLGRLAAAYGGADGMEDIGAETRVGRVVEQVAARNPHCGAFYMALGDALDRMRKYPAAARYYREAQRCMPQLLYARGQLGLLLMRLGDEAEAARLLDESFRDDPFNVRVKNMLEVLDVLDAYATMETDHFVIKFDTEHDEILARYAARYLEEIYPELVDSLGYEPPGKSLFEVFSPARNTSGHGWFSARMVGLPFLGTVAACAGKMVAIASPNDMPEPYDWARVLKHEFVHVVTLQQTHFNIPHWYTEALAVRHEGLPRPAKWNEVLARRARADDLLDLDSITMGFIRPRDPDEWALAYCQAELYAEFMAERFGPDSLKKMLKAYADNLKTPAAIRRCLGVEVEQFEAEYREYVGTIVDGLRGFAAGPSSGLAELKQAARDDPKNADRWASLAEAYLQRRDHASARKCAIVARNIRADHVLAGYILARLHLSIGDTQQAMRILKESLDEQSPRDDALSLLAALELKRGNRDEAERLYRLGADKYPLSGKWLKSLSRIYLETGDNRKLKDSLARLAAMESDSFVLRKKLLELNFEAGDWDAAAHWGTEAYRINVMDADVHAKLGEVFNKKGQLAKAIEAWETATELSPQQLDWRVLLAETHLRAGEKTIAMELLESLLAEYPRCEKAQLLLDKLRSPR